MAAYCCLIPAPATIARHSWTNTPPVTNLMSKTYIETGYPKQLRILTHQFDVLQVYNIK